MKEKNTDNALYAPSLYSRVWKIWLYNTIWTAIFFGLFWGLYGLDALAFELDYFMMWGLAKPRLQIVPVGLSFWFMFRHFFKLLNLIKFTYLTSKHDDDIILYGGCKRMYEGTEGVGKTLNTAYEALFLATAKDRAMRLAYYLKCPYSSMLKDDTDFKVLKESFEYFERDKEHIPHLMANFDIIFEGKKQYPFSMEYLDKTKRLAQGFACGLTELALWLPNSWSRIPADEKKDVHNLKVKNELLSLSRQYFDLSIVADEQRTGEVFLGFRSVVSSNRQLTQRRKVLTPVFLEKLQGLLERRVLKKKTKTTSRLSKLYTKLSNLIQDIGFYVFYYRDKESIKDIVNSEENTFVISCDIPFEFDTTGQRKKYTLYDKSPDFTVTKDK